MDGPRIVLLAIYFIACALTIWGLGHYREIATQQVETFKALVNVTGLIVTKLEQFDYAGASAIALLMLVSSFAMLFAVNLVQWWSLRPLRREA